MNNIVNNFNNDIFLTMVTHDLKTPINALLRALEILQKNKSSCRDTFEYKLIDDMLNSSKYMKNLVENILLKYKSEKEEIKLQLEAHPLENIINKSIEEIHYVLSDKEQKIKFKNRTISNICEIDFIEIKRTISNLLANAHQYAPQKTTITIELKENKYNYSVEITNKTVNLTENNTLNIPSQCTETALYSKTINTGLGLYICKKIIELHRGQIYCKKLKNNKCCFGFSLPKCPTVQK